MSSAPPTVVQARTSVLGLKLMLEIARRQDEEERPTVATYVAALVREGIEEERVLRVIHGLVDAELVLEVCPPLFPEAPFNFRELSINNGDE